MTRIRQPIQVHLVAIIGLLAALSALSYTAWRQEQTEGNRTQRVTAFSMLQTVEARQSVVDFDHYDNDLIAGNPIEDRGKGLYLRDLGIIMPSSIQVKTRFLQPAWAQNWQPMHQDEVAAQRITLAIEGLRGEIRALLVNLQ